MVSQGWQIDIHYAHTSKIFIYGSNKISIKWKKIQWVTHGKDLRLFNDINSMKVDENDFIKPFVLNPSHV